MSPTCGDLLDEIKAQLHGWGSTQDRITPLSADIGPTDTTFQVDYTFGQSVGITPGVVEIDSEQLYVVNADPDTGTCTLARGFGRGYSDTTPASHTAGASIVSRPKFPRIWLLKQINEVIGSVYPSLYAVNKYQTVVTYPSNTYTLPNTNGTPMSVVDCQWQDPIGNWHKCFSYTIDPYDATFRLDSGAMIGRPLRVIYVTQPREFVAETDDYVTATGLPLSARDVLTLGVVANQLPGLDISRAQVSSVEQQDRSRVVPPNAGITASKYVEALFQNRLQNEAESLRRQYRPRMARSF